MPIVRDILRSLDQIAPPRLAFAFDKVGLQVGSPSQQVDRAIVALDPSLGAIRFAKESGAQLLIAHHPVIWEPLADIRSDGYQGQRVVELVRSGISFAAAHTNWDCARNGVNDILAEVLELTGVREFGSGNPSPRMKLVTFVPEASLEVLLDDLSKAGAGEIGNYSRCAFYSEGVGTFHGDDSTHPAIGDAGQTEQLKEFRLEMILPADARRAVEAALREVHPYEQPAYDFIPLTSGEDHRIGRMGEVPTMSLRDFVLQVDERLETRSMVWGDPGTEISFAAVCGGSADDEWRAAQDAGADVLVTGEVKHHVALEAAESGFAIVAAGHYATENPAAVGLALRLKAAVPDVEWTIYEPRAGHSGRPL